MEEAEKIYSFIKTNQTKKKIIDDCIEKKEYWKALRLLNSLLREKSDTDTTKLSYKLHSKLVGFVGILDDYVNLLVSNDFESVVIGAKGLIEYTNKFDSNASKTYYEFVLKKLKNFVNSEEKRAFENLLGYENSDAKIHIVSEKTKDIQIVEQIDSALNDGNFKQIKNLTKNPNNKKSPIIHKMIAEALIFEGKFGDAEKELFNLKEDQKDIYSDCLCLRVFVGEKKLKEAEALVEKLINSNISAAEEIVFISEAFLDAKKTNEVILFLEKQEQKFEFYYPLYFIKGIAHLNLNKNDLAKENFAKTILLWPKQVIAKEFLKAIEEGQTFKKAINARGKLPKSIIKSVENSINAQMAMADIDFAKQSIGKMQETISWLEFFKNEQLTEQYILRLTYCPNGIESIKRTLLSFQSSDWIKSQCIKMLVFVGGNNFDILFVNNNKLSRIYLLLPKTLLSETEVFNDWFKSEDISYQKFIHAYATAFSMLALETQDFESRLAEVADYCLKSLIELMSKKKSDKIEEKYIIAMLLFLTCSNKSAIEFKKKNAKVSKFSTISTVSSELEIESDKLTKLIKQIF